MFISISLSLYHGNGYNLSSPSFCLSDGLDEAEGGRGVGSRDLFSFFVVPHSLDSADGDDEGVEDVIQVQDGVVDWSASCCLLPSVDSCLAGFMLFSRLGTFGVEAGNASEVVEELSIPFAEVGSAVDGD